jgi:TolB-like protein
METKLLFRGILAATALAVFAACAGSPAVSAADELDAAIRETSDYLNANLTEGNKLVILNIQSASPALSEYVIDELIANTVNDRVFTVVDRQQLDLIRAELDFNLSGEVSDSSAQEVGRMLGAQVIISGAVSKLGALYRLRIRALGVENAQIPGQFNRNIPGGPTIAALLSSDATGYGGGTQAASGTAKGGTAAQTAQVAAPAVPAPTPATPAQPVYDREYKIGDRGPGGGIVFYDKEVFSNGWRYLEAASAAREFTAAWGSGNWGSLDKKVNGTGTATGTGKRNTEIIVREFKSADEAADIYAAQVCAIQEDAGGCNDWFLPSKDELNWIYRNLKQKGLGDFRNATYWSSSQEPSSSAWFQDFSNGSQKSDSWYGANTRSYSVRAIRQF